MKQFYPYLLSIFCIYPFMMQAQDTTLATQRKTATQWVEAYNDQHYRRMMKPFITIARILPVKKMLRKEMQPQFERYGTLVIDSITFSSPSRARVHLQHQKDPMEESDLILFFNSKNKISGLTFSGPDFNYADSPATLSRQTVEDRISTIDEYVKNEAGQFGFSGAVMVLHDGRVVYKHTSGYGDLSSKRALNDSSVFELASVSKQFTAMAILMLAEQGKLRLSDTLRHFYPELPYPGVTIEHLLTHTSGLPDYMYLMEKHWDKKKIAGNEDAIAMLAEKHPSSYFKPGKAFRYSNTGYMLLSSIIQKTSGKSYNTFLEEQIFQPLDMNHALVYNTRRSLGDTVENYAYGYVYHSKKEQYMLPDDIKSHDYVRYLDRITGDGMVNASLTDLAKWDEALRKGTLISDSMWQKMTSSYLLSSGKESGYGYGFFIEDKEHHKKVLWHTGGWPGYHTLSVHFADEPLSIIVLSNNEHQEFMKMGDRIARILFR